MFITCSAQWCLLRSNQGLQKTRLKLPTYDIYLLDREENGKHNDLRNFILLTAAHIIKHPAKINGLLLPYFERHLSLHTPTHG